MVGTGMNASSEKRKFAKGLLMAGVSVMSLTSAQMAWGQASGTCPTIGGIIDPECEFAEAGTVVTMPPGENTETGTGVDAGEEGYAISVNGETVEGDPRVIDRQNPVRTAVAPRQTQRKADVQLAKAEVQVRFDGLDVRPRLDLGIEATTTNAGSNITLHGHTNYPHWIKKGEARFIQIDERGRRRTLKVVALPANGTVTTTVPEGENVVVVYRVYDDRNRYNETVEMPLTQRTVRQSSGDFEAGTDKTTRQGFTPRGGAVTVSGQNVAPGSRVETMGETVQADADGSFVVQRILPPGDHGVDVKVNGWQQRVDVVRDITIPASEWFYVGVVDITVGKTLSAGPGASTGTYQHGRIAGYANGKTASGYEITVSIDTGEEDLDDIFRNLDKKDPRSLLARFDDDRGFPVYGDDSRAEDDAPTSGKFYAKIERDNNYLMWGNYQGRVASAKYIRNDRTLYGLQGHYETNTVTANGDAKAAVTIYAAQPDNLPGRDVFRGTGGSVYFLSRQDISLGSETLFIAVVDPVTGRIIDRVELVAGRDYDINYLQGQVVLSGPLSGFVPGGLAGTGTSTNETRLVAQYEFTPTTGDVDVFSYGGRAHAWAGDKWRVGATAMVEDRGTTEHKVYGLDVRYQHTEGTWAEVEFAKSEGSANASTFSADGGFIINSTTPTGLEGQALRFEAALDLEDLNTAWNGDLSVYFEDRTAGFSTSDYDVDSDETLWGLSGRIKATQKLDLSFAVDRYENALGDRKDQATLEAKFEQSDRLTWHLGLDHLDQVDVADASKTGTRTQLAVRADVAVTDRWTVSPYVRHSLKSSGALAKDDRYGVATKLTNPNGWSVEADVSDGTLGMGVRAMVVRETDSNNSTYFGYELTPDRDLNGVTLSGRDRGRFVAGGKRKINDYTTAWGENSYDLFGTHESLSAAYGVEVTPTEHLSYGGSIERGEVSDSINGDFTRTAFSVGVRYDNGEDLAAKARLELRKERGLIGGGSRNVDSLLVSGTLRYKFSDSARLLVNLHHADTKSDNASFIDGDLTQFTLGYAYRPVDNDKLNTLFKYTYLRDMYGQQIDGTATPGPRQVSHILNWDTEYDLNRHWTVGGKIGVRKSKTSFAAGQPFVDNDAGLIVANARYHVTHKWDSLFEVRHLAAWSTGFAETSGLLTVYRHVGNNAKVGVGYNFGSFSDDLTDMTYDDKGVFINLVAKF